MGPTKRALSFHLLRKLKLLLNLWQGSTPSIGSGVYNRFWKVVAGFVHNDFVQQQAKAHSPNRLFLWASVLLAAGSLFL